MTISDVRARIGQSLGFAGFDGSRTAYQNLSAADQERLSLAVLQYILANPEQFGAEQVRAAQLAATKQNFGTLGDYRNPDLLDRAAEFVQEYGHVAGNAVETAAGVAGRSAQSVLGFNLGWLVLGVAAIFAVAYFGPRWRAAAPGAV